MFVNFFHWLGRNLSSMLLALLLAVVVWVSAVLTSNPNEERTFIRNLEVVGQADDLVSTGDIPGQIGVTLVAPRSVLDSITNNSAALQAWIDLTGMTSGTHQILTKVKIDASPVRLARIDPSSLEVSLEKLVTESMPVELAVTGDPSIGYRKGDLQVEPRAVTVTGRESQVKKVNQVIAALDISGASETIQSNVNVSAVDANGNPVPDLTISPRQVHVTQPINLLGGYRTVVVKVVTSGQLAPGYRLTQISVTPPTVTVFSTNPLLVNELPGYVETLPLNLNGLTDDIEIRMELSLPKGITLVGEQSVLVQVGVAAIEGNLTITAPVEAVGLPPELQAEISPKLVDLIVSGPIPVLDTLSPDSFRVIVDITGLDIGAYQLTPVVDLVPNEVVVTSILPETVEVIIRQAPTPTPTSPANRATPSATPVPPTPTPTRTPSRTPTRVPSGTPTPKL
jgi:YbbR domain-containing protein